VYTHAKFNTTGHNRGLSKISKILLVHDQVLVIRDQHALDQDVLDQDVLDKDVLG
jgi:hypothetical protein